MLYRAASQIYIELPTMAPTAPYFTSSSLSLFHVTCSRSLSNFTISAYFDLLPTSESHNSPPSTLLSFLPMLHRAHRSLRISLALMQNRHFSKCALLAANASISCTAKQIRNAMWLLAIFFFSQTLRFWVLPVMLGQSAPNKYGEFSPEFSASCRWRQILILYIINSTFFKIWS